MPDVPAQRYRFWGSIKPPADREPIRAAVAPKTDGTGTTATIRLYDPIDSWGGAWGVSAKEFAAALDDLSTEVSEINLLINSPGGETFEALAIVNALRAHPATVTATVQGLAASAASFIAASADNTVMAPNSQMMIHDSWGLVVGPAADMHAYADVLDKLSDNMASLYANAAGGAPAAWRAAMQAETWYTADEAVEAGLAQSIATAKPSDADPAAKSRFDLSIYTHAGRADAPVPAMPAKAASTDPAKPPVQPTPKEAADMADLIKEMRARLGIADDVELDEAGVLAEFDKQTTEAKAAFATKPEPKADIEKPEIPAGKVLVSETLLAELQEGAKDGREARAKQLAEERDKTIAAAFAQGKISADRRESWTKAWDIDPEGTKADLESLEVRFPVAKTTGYAGTDGTDGDGVQPFAEEEAAALAELAGVSKEGLMA